jgi:hypothetical protein
MVFGLFHVFICLFFHHEEGYVQQSLIHQTFLGHMVVMDIQWIGKQILFVFLVAYIPTI